MKNIHLIYICLMLQFLCTGVVNAQTDVQQKIERYLYTSYSSNKAAMRENERTTRILEEHLDKYLVTLDKPQRAIVKDQEKEVKEYLQRIQKIRDVQQLKNEIETTRLKSFAILDKFINAGLDMPADVMVCKKLIIIKLAEFELLRQKQDKLLALLKDDYSRQEFVQALLNKGHLELQEDIKAFAQSVEVEVLNFKM